MKKGWHGGVLAALLLLQSVTAWADSFGQGGEIGPPGNLTITSCSNSNWNAGVCNNLLPGGTEVIGFKIVNINASAMMGLYDATAVPRVGHAGIVDELTEASAADGAAHLWPSPVRFGTGVSVWCNIRASTTLTDGTLCVVYSR